MLTGSPDYFFFSTGVRSSPGRFPSPMSENLRKESAQSFRLVVISVHFVTVAGGVECGSVVNNTLSSPAYPGNYPSGMDCNYSVPILPGMATKITFHEFNVESSHRCR